MMIEIMVDGDGADLIKKLTNSSKILLFSSLPFFFWYCFWGQIFVYYRIVTVTVTKLNPIL